MDRSWIIAAIVALVAPMALAQTTALPQPRDDTVTLSLALEDWVETQTVRTDLTVDAALPGSDAGKVRAEVLNAVKALASGADWRFTSFNHNQDSSGLERWHAVLEARLPEAQLGGLSDRAKQASKPGLQIAMQTVDFSPTLAETEAVRAKLRGEMYKKVNEALAQLNQAEPDRKYRIASILIGRTGTYGKTGDTRSQNMQIAMPAAPALALNQPDQQAGTIDHSEKLRLDASVTFAAVAPNQ